MSDRVPNLRVVDEPPASSELIYEVTLEVPQRAVGRLDTWLRPHLRAMLALPGFLAAQVIPEDQIPSGSDPGRLRRVIRYRLTNYTALRRYLHQHAASVRAAGARRFGAELQASRRLLDAEGRELLSDSALASGSVHCLNCGALLGGAYCSACGQAHHSLAAPLKEVAGEFFGEHFGLDTKLLRSVLPLLFRPGFLSREYSAGRRARYISPLRLYVFCSLLFFFVAWLAAPRQFLHFTSGAAAAQSRTPAATPPASAARDASAARTDVTVFGRHVDMSNSEFQHRIEAALAHDLPKLMFVFLPLVALLLWLAYLRSRRYYVEHLAFTLHNHAFVFVAMLAMVLANLVAQHAAWATAPAHYFKLLVGWYVVVYVFLAMRFYYRQSFAKTLRKYLLIGGVYWVCLFSAFILGLALAFASVAA